jgi:outer membrane murein-binding lipoprotein Lpp
MMADDEDKADALATQVGELRKAYPTLEERLDRYRGRRDAYEAKRMSARTETAATPAEHRANSREFRG